MIQLQFTVLEVLKTEVRMESQKVYHVVLLKIVFVYLFIYYLKNFWPHHAVCRILVPRPGIEPRPLQ